MSFPEKILWKVTDENVLSVFRKNGLWDFGLSPDCTVFLGKKGLIIKTDAIIEEFHNYYDEYNNYPTVIEYNNNLFIIADSVKKALEIQSVLSFSAQVIEMNDNESINLLTKNDQNCIMNLDSEKYRRNMK